MHRVDFTWQEEVSIISNETLLMQCVGKDAATGLVGINRTTSGEYVSILGCRSNTFGNILSLVKKQPIVFYFNYYLLLMIHLFQTPILIYLLILQVRTCVHYKLHKLICLERCNYNFVKQTKII
jgi:hypothetical protein